MDLVLRRMTSLIFSFVIFVYVLNYVHSFKTLTPIARCSYSAIFGYKEMLANAQAQRRNPAQKQHREVPKEETNAPSSTKAQLGSKTPHTSSLPFDDEMYGHLKFVIDKITTRMKSPTVLSKEELVSFENSINIIIADMKGGAPPRVSVPSPPQFDYAPDVQG